VQQNLQLDQFPVAESVSTTSSWYFNLPTLLKAHLQVSFSIGKDIARQDFLAQKTISAPSGKLAAFLIISRNLLRSRFRSTALPKRLGIEIP
jgi:hypothetical protein